MFKLVVGDQEYELIFHPAGDNGIRAAAAYFTARFIIPGFDMSSRLVYQLGSQRIGDFRFSLTSTNCLQYRPSPDPLLPGRFIICGPDLQDLVTGVMAAHERVKLAQIHEEGLRDYIPIAVKAVDKAQRELDQTVQAYEEAKRHTAKVERLVPETIKRCFEEAAITPPPQ
jgi:hypothetical protein